MHRLKFILTLLVFNLITNAPIHAQLTPTELDSLMQDALKKFNVAGAAIAIVKDGTIIHQKGYGVTSIATNQPVNEHTNFAIASNSKAFTTAALSILVDQGKLNWDDLVIKHIPEFKMYNDYVTANFNIQDLLTHRSGLGLGAGDLMFFPDGSDFSINDVLTSFQHFEPVSAFRTKFDYDNLLYLVAGEVIARVSGMSYENFIQRQIIEPLQMNHTFASGELMVDKSNLAIPHSTQTGTLKAMNPFEDMVNSAAGGILSNVADMSNWMMMHLNDGLYGPNLTDTLFSLQNHAAMWRLHTVTNNNVFPRYNKHFSGYGLGWFLSDKKGHFSVSHTGGLPGMLSIVTMLPDLDLGIVILTNTENGGAGLFSAVSNTLIDSYLGLDDYHWVDLYSADFGEQKNEADALVNEVWETVAKARKTVIKTADFIGVYEDQWFGKVEIFLKDKQLWFKSYRSPKLNGPMAFYNANTFAIKWEYQDMNCDAFTLFTLDETGKAQSITMKGISPAIDFSFDFQDLDLRRVE